MMSEGWSPRSCRKTTAGSTDSASKFQVAFISKDNTMNEKERQLQIIEDFKAGNQRFLAGTSLHSSSSSLKKLKEYAKAGQTPHAIVLCCSDSRAPVELIFDQDIGDCFVIRVAGNIVAPSLVGSVE